MAPGCTTNQGCEQHQPRTYGSFRLRDAGRQQGGLVGPGPYHGRMERPPFRASCVGVVLCAALLLRASAAHAQATPAAPPGRDTSSWTDGIITSVGAGATLGGGLGGTVVGDGALGYQHPVAGISLSGSFNATDRIQGNTGLDARRVNLALQAWLAPGRAATRFEIRSALAMVDYATSRLELANDQSLFQENSFMLRMHVIAGLRHEPSPRQAFGIWLGLGAQAEGYDSGVATRIGGGQFRFTGGLSGSFSSVVTLAARGYYSVLDGTLSLRGSVDAATFQIEHDSYSFQLDRAVTQTLERRRARQNRLDGAAVPGRRCSGVLRLRPGPARGARRVSLQRGRRAGDDDQGPPRWRGPPAHGVLSIWAGCAR